MKIIIDSREKLPLDFSRWPDVETVAEGLGAGDYSIAGMGHEIALERKELGDLVASLGRERERFERELTRARGLRFFAVVVEASLEDVAQHRYQSQMEPASVLQSLFAYHVRFGVPTIWAGSRQGAAYVVHGLLSKYLRERHLELQTILRAHGEPKAA